MSLLNLSTNLKSLKYGSDRPGGGDSGQPYIKTDINTVDRGFNKLRLTKFEDGLIRGGAIGALNASVVDTLRIGKFFLGFPKGPLFIAKQVGLQLSNPRLEAKKGISGFLSGVGPTRIYNLGINTIAQVSVNAFGKHFNRHGLLPVQDDSTKYLSVVKSKDDNREEGKDNRLVKLVDALIGKPDELKIDDYTGGPNSVYGIGRTIIRRYEYTEDNDKIVKLKEKSTIKANAGRIAFGKYIPKNPSNQPTVLAFSYSPNSPQKIYNPIVENQNSILKNSVNSKSKTYENLKDAIEDQINNGNKFIPSKDITHTSGERSDTNSPINYYNISPISKDYDTKDTLAVNSGGIDPINQTKEPSKVMAFKYGDAYLSGRMVDPRLGYIGLKKIIEDQIDSGSNFSPSKDITHTSGERSDTNSPINYYNISPISKDYNTKDTLFENSGEIDPINKTKEPSRVMAFNYDAEAYTGGRMVNPKLGYVGLRTIIDNQINNGSNFTSSKDITHASGERSDINSPINYFNISPISKAYKTGTLGSKEIDPSRKTESPTIPVAFDYEGAHADGRMIDSGSGYTIVKEYVDNLTVKSKRPLQSDYKENIGLERSVKNFKYYGKAESSIGGTKYSYNNTDLFKREDDDILTNKFTIIDPFTSKEDSFFLSSYMKGFKEDFNATWNDVNYSGRAESFYIYSKFKRTVSFNLQIPCFNRNELYAKHRLLGRLASTTAGAYNPNGFLGGVLIKLKIGNYIDNEYSILNSLNYNIPDDASWDVKTPNEELAMLIEASFNFTIIHKSLPQYSPTIEGGFFDHV